MKHRIQHPEAQTRSPHISSAVACDGWLHLSGQGPIDLATREVARGTIEEETRLTLRHIDSLLKAAGCSRGDVVKCVCYLADLKDFAGFDAEYREFFASEIPPARTTVQAPLLRGIKVEIEAVARIPQS
jgi:2-iminobutanoate/2-iminopropanoate deaminase